ncbi:MAG: endonuclease III [Tissierellales bacterium]|nr:endonuclease III [Tissierellales bacterium]MBN2826821.1 endonuclease III [Tissierellales bacterium]
MDVNSILLKLQRQHPDAQCELRHETPFQLLIATILSAQATDKSVNKLTEDLYLIYPDLQAFLKLSLEEIESKIKSIGLYKNKSRSIYRLCKILNEQYGGEVPKEYEALISLPGVGRKTASVVQSVAFNIPAMAVDTHVFRVSRRIGLSKGNTADQVSDDLMALIDKNDWIKAHHLLIFHGRKICKAKHPLCTECIIEEECQKIGI